MFVKSLLEIPSQQQLKMFMVINSNGLHCFEAKLTKPHTKL